MTRRQRGTEAARIDPRESVLVNRWFGKHEAGKHLAELDAADKAAGIYRVSLDAAIEAAAEAKYADAYPDYARYWKSEPDVVREVYRERVRGSVTAAVMGGAQ